MSTLTISDLDPAVAEALRHRASAHGRSLEAEARLILSDAIGKPVPREKIGLGEAIRRRFAPLGGVDDLVLPLRDAAEEPPIVDR